MSEGVEQLSLNTPGTRSRLRGGIKKRDERKHSNRKDPYKSAKKNTVP